MSLVRERRKKGFTLIELLIVVAIIAVLAAIAVPNFLEAQTRSKVSRVKSDLRTLTTALEVYVVDWNRYPPTAGTFAPSFEDRLRHLTSPIAYQASLPADPFSRRESQWRGALALTDRIDMYCYNTGVASAGFGGSDPNDPAQMQWSLASGGPDGVIGYPYYAFTENRVRTGRYADFVYDPTNGTISDGDIFRRGGKIVMPTPDY